VSLTSLLFGLLMRSPNSAACSACKTPSYPPKRADRAGLLPYPRCTPQGTTLELSPGRAARRSNHFLQCLDKMSGPSSTSGPVSGGWVTSRLLTRDSPDS
jgi:hypothetical protein